MSSNVMKQFKYYQGLGVCPPRPSKALQPMPQAARSSPLTLEDSVFQIKRVKQTLSVATAKLSQKNTQIKQTKRSILSQEKYYDLYTQLKTSYSVIQDLLQEEKERNESLAAEGKALRSKLLVLNQQYKQLHQKCLGTHQLELKCIQLEEDSKSSLQRIDSVNAESTKLSHQLDRYKQINQQLSARLQSLEREEEQLRQKLSQAESENGKLHEKIEQVQKEEQNKLSALQSNYQSQLAELQEKKSRFEEMNEQLSNQLAEFQATKVAMKQMEAGVVSKQVQLSALKQKLAALKAQIQSESLSKPSQQAIEQAKADLAKTEQLLQQQILEKTSIQGKLAAQIQRRGKEQKQKLALMRINKAISDQLQQLRAKSSTLQKKVGSLTFQLSSKKSLEYQEVARLKELIKNQQQQLSENETAASESRRLNQQIKIGQGQRQQLQKKLQSCNQSIKIGAVQRKKLQQQRQELQLQLRKQVELKRQAKERCVELECQVQYVRMQAQSSCQSGKTELQLKIDEAQARLASLANENSRLMAELQSSKMKSRESESQLSTQMEKGEQNTKKNYRALLREVQSLRQRLREEEERGLRQLQQQKLQLEQQFGLKTSQLLNELDLVKRKLACDKFV